MKLITLEQRVTRKKKKARTERAPIEEIAFCDDTPACHGGKQRYKFEKKPEKKKLKGA